MKIYLIEKQKDTELYAYGIDGTEKTLELIQLIIPDDEEEFSPCFYKMSASQKLECGSDAEYAITYEAYSEIYELIENTWQEHIDRIAQRMDQNRMSQQELEQYISKVTDGRSYVI